MPKFLTFQKMLPGCEEGNREAWKVFLTDYTPMALRFFDIYSAWAPDARLDNWRGALGALCANECATLKGFSHQSEREFLVDLRAFLQDWIAARVHGSEDAADPPAPTLDTLGALLSGLPLSHQEIAFLTLAGYSRGSVEDILRITPTVAGEGLERLHTSFGPLTERTEDCCLWPAAWVSICAAVRADAQKDCTSLRQLIRIFDGQASWYEKTPSEEHRAKCLHCMELWTSLREVVAWDRARQPWPAEKLDALWPAIPVKPEKRKSSFFARILGK